MGIFEILADLFFKSHIFVLSINDLSISGPFDQFDRCFSSDISQFIMLKYASACKAREQDGSERI